MDWYGDSEPSGKSTDDFYTYNDAGDPPEYNIGENDQYDETGNIPAEQCEAPASDFWDYPFYVDEEDDTDKYGVFGPDIEDDGPNGDYYRDLNQGYGI